MIIQTCRANWHVGVGVDGLPEWDRLAIVRERLKTLGLRSRVEEIEKEQIDSMEKLWDKEHLQKP